MSLLWRPRYTFSLRDLAEMFLIRGFVFSYDAVRDREDRVKSEAGPKMTRDEYVALRRSFRRFFTSRGERGGGRHLSAYRSCRSVSSTSTRQSPNASATRLRSRISCTSSIQRSSLLGASFARRGASYSDGIIVPCGV
jgi:hypothetical protein